MRTVIVGATAASADTVIDTLAQATSQLVPSNFMVSDEVTVIPMTSMRGWSILYDTAIVNTGRLDMLTCVCGGDMQCCVAQAQTACDQIPGCSRVEVCVNKKNTWYMKAQMFDGTSGQGSHDSNWVTYVAESAQMSETDAILV